MIQTSYSDQIFKRYISEKSSVAYYPSAGVDDKRVLEFPFDVIILSDSFPYMGSNKVKNKIFYDSEVLQSIIRNYYPDGLDILEKKIQAYLSYAVIRRNDRIFIFFFEDNNHTVERIKSARVQLDALITVNDGCQEGGNYECINRSDWKNKLNGNYKPDTIYVTDHSENKRFQPIRTTGGTNPEMSDKKKALENLYKDYIS